MMSTEVKTGTLRADERGVARALLPLLLVERRSDVRMGYIKAWADFQDAAEALYAASPTKVRAHRIPSILHADRVSGAGALRRKVPRRRRRARPQAHRRHHRAHPLPLITFPH
jgi:hypothetical protein